MSGILGQRLVQPPVSILRDHMHSRHGRTARSVDTADRRPVEQALAAEGVHRDIDLSEFKASPDQESAAAATSSRARIPQPSEEEDDLKGPTSHSPKRNFHVQPKDHRPKRKSDDDHGKGHAHNPLDDHLFLAVGPHGSDDPPDPPAVSESPAAAETNIYETAYSEEIERIRSKSGTGTTLYLTRRVEEKTEFQDDKGLIGRGDGETPKGGLSKILGLVKKKEKQKDADAAADGTEKAEGAANDER